MRFSNTFVVLLALVVTAFAGDPPRPRDVSALLEPIRAAHDLPGMVGAILAGHRVVAAGAVGVRERGKDAKVEVTDPFHLGSCTKAMTATLAALLVSEGKISYETTVGEVFGDLPHLDPKWKEVTLKELLTHHAGAPADLRPGGLWARLWKRQGTPTEQRLRLVEGVVTHPPVNDPGTTFLYSNAGFAIAGAMLEKITGTPWEKLIRERLFRPLGMKSAGFGAPGSRDRVDAPRGHTAAGKPVEPGPNADNPPAIGPAGTVHASILDWAKFVALHLEIDQKDGRGLVPPAFRELHVPWPDSKVSYAMGWVVARRPWAGDGKKGGRVLTHNGSNTMWFAVTWLAPEKDFAVLVCTNQGGDGAAKACDEASWALIRDHLKND